MGASSTLYGLRRTDARHRQWPHAGTHLVRHPVLLHHVVDFVETAGRALHNEEPERISRLFDETIADFPIGISPSAGTRQVPSARPQAAVQAVRALTPAPGRSRIRELRIQNEVNPTSYWRAPKPGLPIISDLIGRQGTVQDKARVFADSDVGQNTSIVGKRGSPVMQSS